jgi:hypothetical protein
MQLRKHAAPPLGDSFFTAGVAVPPDFTGTDATLAPIDLPALPPGEARLVSAGRLMSASATTAIAKLRYMSVSFGGLLTQVGCRALASNYVKDITE